MRYTYADFLRDHVVEENVKKSEDVAPVIVAAPIKEEKKVVKAPVVEKKVDEVVPVVEEKAETTEAPVIIRKPMKKTVTKVEDVKAED